MINYGFPPQRRWTGPVLHSFNGFVPSLVTGTEAAFEAVIDAFIAVSQNRSQPYTEAAFYTYPDGRRFTSDMLILLSRPDLYLDLKFPSSILGPDVNKTVLLHFDKAEVRRWARAQGKLPLKCEAVRIIRNFE